MNNITTKTISNIKKIKHKITSKKYGTFFCYETYKNDELIKQYFKPANKKFHKCYEANHMEFEYYGKNVNLNKIKNIFFNEDFNKLPKQVLIKDLKYFQDFDKLYCFWCQMDGNIYSITEPKPLITLLRLIIRSNNFDIKKCKEKLLKNKKVKSIKINNNGSFNWDVWGKENLVVDFIPSKKLMDKLGVSKAYMEDDIISKYLGLVKFQLK